MTSRSSSTAIAGSSGFRGSPRLRLRSGIGGVGRAHAIGRAHADVVRRPRRFEPLAGEGAGRGRRLARARHASPGALAQIAPWRDPAAVPRAPRGDRDRRMTTPAETALATTAILESGAIMLGAALVFVNDRRRRLLATRRRRLPAVEGIDGGQPRTHGVRARGQHDHAAARQEPLPLAVEESDTQGSRAAHRATARGRAVQAAYPRALPQPHRVG